MIIRRFIWSFVLLAVVLPTTGCGLVLAPIKGPDALPNNRTVTHRGEIVDEAGVPIRGVKIHVAYPHATTWLDYVMGFDSRPSKLNLIGDGRYSFILDRSEADFTRIRFEKAGYQPFEMAEAFDAMLFETPYGTEGAFLTVPDEKFSFGRYPNYRPGDLLRVVMQRADEPRHPHVPTIIERRESVTASSR